MIGIGTTKRRIAWRNDRRGGALLAVLWLSAALSVIAFSVASTVRGETERASTLADGLRSYYLARGGLDRAIMYFVLGSKALGPPGTPAAPPRPAPAAPPGCRRSPRRRSGSACSSHRRRR